MLGESAVNDDERRTPSIGAGATKNSKETAAVLGALGVVVRSFDDFGA